MTESLDALLDHASALHGAQVLWHHLQDGKWRVMLLDKNAGSPAGYGTTLEAAAKQCLYNLRAYEERVVAR